jgi:stage IV sporulation protein FB
VSRKIAPRLGPRGSRPQRNPSKKPIFLLIINYGGYMRKYIEYFVWTLFIVGACKYFDNLGITIFFIFLHELGHYIVGVFLGLNFGYATLLPFGVRFGFKEEFIDPLKDIIVSFSGPLINFLFFILFLCFNSKGRSFELYGTVNLVLFIFNMLPAAFLDGGRIIKAFFSMYKGIYYGHLITNLNGIIFGGIMLITTVISSITLRKVPLLLMSMFFIYKSSINLKYITINVIKDILMLQKANKNNGDFLIVMKSYKGKTKILDILKKFCFNKYYVIYIMDNGYLRYNINETDLIKVYYTYGNVNLEECALYKSAQEVQNDKNY